MKNFGIQLDPDTNDFFVVNGSLARGNITRQNQAAIIGSSAGAFKLSPTVGVGIIDMLLDNDYGRFSAAIAQQLRADGQTVKKIVLNSTTTTIDADY